MQVKITLYIFGFTIGVIIIFGILGLIKTIFNLDLSDPIEQALNEVTSKKRKKK